MTWSRSSRRSVPITRATYAFRQGEAGAVMTSSMPKLSTLRLTDPLAVYTVAVPNQITRSSIKRERFYQLMRRPLCRRVLGDVEVDDSPSIVSEIDEDEQHPTSLGRDDKEVDRYQIPEVLVEKRPPGGRRPPISLRSVFLNSGFRNLNSKLRELRNYSRRAPRWIGIPSAR